MAKRKEIKFKWAGSHTLQGRQDGVIFWIFTDKQRAAANVPAYTVAANDTKGMGRNINTGGHMHFNLEKAKEFCQRIAAGEISLEDLEALKAEFNAEDRAREQAVIREAAAKAKRFRNLLEEKGLRYIDLLELEAMRGNLGDIGHNMLMGYERGEGWPEC